MFIKTKDLSSHPDTSKIAPDPLELSKKEFVERLRAKKSGRIKNVLMDQSVVSGIGNIYSDEILFETSVHPETNTNILSDKKLGEFWKEAKIVLNKLDLKDKAVLELALAILYLGEGTKKSSGFRMSNSDPMIFGGNIAGRILTKICSNGDAYKPPTATGIVNL